MQSLQGKVRGAGAVEARGATGIPRAGPVAAAAVLRLPLAPRVQGYALHALAAKTHQRSCQLTALQKSVDLKGEKRPPSVKTDRLQTAQILMSLDPNIAAARHQAATPAGHHERG